MEDHIDVSEVIKGNITPAREMKSDDVKIYLTKNQLLEKYKFLSANMLKNMLFKDTRNFRNMVVRKIGRRILFDEANFLKYIDESKEI